MPRGYGGVAVLWRKSLDKYMYIKSLPDGGNRIQCVKIKLKEPILVVSVYLPTKTTNDNFETFEDCFDQLNEINQKYELTHKVLIGGDFNEDTHVLQRTVILKDHVLLGNLWRNVALTLNIIDYFY